MDVIIYAVIYKKQDQSKIWIIHIFIQTDKKKKKTRFKWSNEIWVFGECIEIGCSD